MTAVKRSPVFPVPRIARGYGSASPLESLGAGCHPSQVEEFNAAYRKGGIVGAYHKPDGTCVFESRKARNQVLKSRGMIDQDGGYGDYTGSSSSVTK